MNMLVKTLMVIFLLSIVLPPNIEAASVAPTETQSASVSNTLSNTPSFSGSMSSSWSSSHSYSGTFTATISGTTSATFSSLPSLSYTPSTMASQTHSPSSMGSMSHSLSSMASMSYSPSSMASMSYSISSMASMSYSTSSLFALSLSLTMSLQATKTAPGYFLNNHCPYEATTICPFWGPDVFPKYRMTVMNTNGSMLTIDNIDLLPTEVPQYPISSRSTNGFIEPGQTYRVSVFGCDSAGANCVQPWTPMVVTTPEKQRAKCDPLYLCKQHCTVPSPGVVQCTWVNGSERLKRALIRVTVCYNVNTLQLLPLPNPRRVITTRRPNPPPNVLRLGLPPNALCHIQFIVRYRGRQFLYRYAVFS